MSKTEALREAAQAVLSVLDNIRAQNMAPDVHKLREALRAALAQQPAAPLSERDMLRLISSATTRANEFSDDGPARQPAASGEPATQHTEAVDHAHELLRRLGYQRDGDHFINVNRAGAEAMHVTTIATIVHAALIVAGDTAQPAPAVPPGWHLVPVEPTPEMLAAVGRCTFPDGQAWLDADARATWAAMLAAAPTAQQEPKP